MWLKLQKVERLLESSHVPYEGTVGAALLTLCLFVFAYVCIFGG